MRSSHNLASRPLKVFVACAILLAAGCGTRSPEQRLNDALAKAGKTREPVFPLAGKVTVDGAPPSGDLSILVILNDPKNPDQPLNERPSTDCKRDGTFSFTTTDPGDGVKPGTYVITFAQLGRTMGRRRGPDALENLYNDPEKNAQVPEFKIDHQAPGKKDYVFDLKVAGEPPGAVGPHSYTHD
jgi:hypothetical protein